VLIDTGSTHSFVDQLLAKKMEMPAETRSQLSVMVASGEKIPCTGCCMVVAFTLRRMDFQANLHLLTLGGCDMVLVVDWLSTFGPILWEFAKLTMKFQYHRKEMLL
jgi:hypothetical protein